MNQPTKKRRVPRKLKKCIRSILKGWKIKKDPETVICRYCNFMLKGRFKDWVLKLDSPGSDTLSIQGKSILEAYRKPLNITKSAPKTGPKSS